MAPTKIGIVGFGKIARDQHVPAIRSNPDLELVAVASRSREGPDGVQRRFATLSEMLARVPDLGAVAICTPPEPRPALVREALAAGRHVLLEKPPAATVSEAEELAHLAVGSDRSVFATWHARFNPAVEEARRIVGQEGARRIAISWREDVRHWHPGQDWIWQPGGFGVFDPGINALSILTRIVPEPVSVRSAILQFPSNRDTPIAAVLTFAGGDGTEIAADFDWRETGPQVWNVAIETGSGSRLLLSDGGATLTREGATVVAEPSREYPLIYRRFAELIRTGASDIDLAPLRLVADAFLIGKRVATEAFA